MTDDDKNRKLIHRMKKKGNLESSKVEEAILGTPREEFVPEQYKEHAYADAPLSIGHGQTVSQPSVVAKMTQWLQPEEGDKILEVGAGSGWQAAILGRLVDSEGEVYSVERIQALAKGATKNLEEVGIENVEVIHGDGSIGLETNAPYDGVICTAACPSVPEEWKEQTEEGGRIVAPVGGGFTQNMLVLEKEDGEIKTVKRERGYRFVPLKGEKGFTE